MTRRTQSARIGGKGKILVDSHVRMKGRDEAGFRYGMEWLRHHDRYDDQAFVDPYVKFKTQG